MRFRERAMHHICSECRERTVLTGYEPSEHRMFGLVPIAHDRRYGLDDASSTIIGILCNEDEELTSHWRRP